LTTEIRGERGPEFSPRGAVSVRGNTTQRERDRSVIRRTKPPCGICGDPIDYTLRSPDPGSFEVDHIVPLNRGGTDTPDNKQASHRRCNRTKWDRLAEDNAPRVFVTARNW
jgi:5-methylcytosine-specific restriction endonuclease McrA